MSAMDDYYIPFTPPDPGSYLCIVTDAERAVIARALGISLRLSEAVDREDDAALLRDLRGRFARDEDEAL